MTNLMIQRFLIAATFFLVAVDVQAQIIPNQCPGPVATIISPMPKSTLPEGAVTFNWCNASGDYFLTIESIPGAHNIFYAFPVGVDSVTLGPECNIPSATNPTTGCIPTNGETIFLTLWTNTALKGKKNYVAAPTVTYTAPNAQLPPVTPPILWGTTGACSNAVPGGPCTQTSTLVKIDPDTGALIQTIGEVGYTINGLAWDRTSQKLYASTSIGCGLAGSVCPFHGLITIDPLTGAGSPVAPTLQNFGLAGADSLINSIAIDSIGQMVGWYDEVPGPGVIDTFVRIDKLTGKATEYPNTGIDTHANGLAFDQSNLLWNIDGPSVGTQTAYLLNYNNGNPIRSNSLALHVPVDLKSPTMAALGDFNPVSNVYYGLNFDPTCKGCPTGLVMINPREGTVTPGPNIVDGNNNNVPVRTLAFVK